MVVSADSLKPDMLAHGPGALPHGRVLPGNPTGPVYRLANVNAGRRTRGLLKQRLAPNVGKPVQSQAGADGLLTWMDRIYGIILEGGSAVLGSAIAYVSTPIPQNRSQAHESLPTPTRSSSESAPSASCGAASRPVYPVHPVNPCSM